MGAPCGGEKDKGTGQGQGQGQGVAAVAGSHALRLEAMGPWHWHWHWHGVADRVGERGCQADRQTDREGQGYASKERGSEEGKGGVLHQSDGRTDGVRE